MAAAPTGFAHESVGPNLTNPTNIEFAPNGQVFVLEQSGILKTWPTLESFLASQSPSIFANLTNNVHGYWDRGALGLAIHPEYPSVPYVYVLYTYDAPPGQEAPTWGTGCPNPTPGPTSSNEGCVVTGRLSRLTAGPGGTAMTGSEHVIIHDWCQQYPSHSIGDIKFGPDGALYVSAGDGASFNWVDYGQLLNPCNDPPGGTMTPPTAQGGALRAQGPRTTANPIDLDGTVLRIDPITGLAMPDNPWIASPDPHRRMVVAYGLRNPFRFTIRPGTTDLYVGDVGWSTWEELNRVPNPTAVVRNFGWPCYEGGHVNGSSTSLVQAGYDSANLDVCESLYAEGPGAVSAPMFAYRHNQDITHPTGDPCPPSVSGQTRTSSSITGLEFYTQGGFPGIYNGALFGSDYARSCIWVMFPGSDGVPDPSTIQVFEHQALGPVDLAMGPDGNLYYVRYSGNVRIGRFRFVGTNTPPIAVIDATPTSGSAPLTVEFDGSGSHDPDQDPIVEYAWDLNGNGQYNDAFGPTTSRVFDPGTHTVSLRVTDSRGESGTANAVINASNSPPVPVIASPSQGSLWAVGDLISFSGSATDPDQGSLPASSLSWAVILHHCAPDGSCHIHPIQTFDGVSGGSFPAPDHEYPSWIELRLTAVDQYGLGSTVSRELMPRTVDLTFDTAPSGLSLAISGINTVTPETATFIVGASVPLGAPLNHASGEGWSWQFHSWAHGGPSSQTLSAPSTPASYVALYNAPPLAQIVATPQSGMSPLFVTLDGSGSQDRDGDTIVSYTWDLNGDGIFGDASGSLVTWTFMAGTHEVSLRVIDSRGGVGETTIQVEATNSPPEAVIASPAPGTLWSIGQTIDFSGSATDPEDGPLPPSALRWEVLLHPCAPNAGCAPSTISELQGVSSGAFTVNQADQPAWVEIRLTAVDSDAVEGTVSLALDPQTIELTLATEPEGLTIGVDGEAMASPHVRTLISGSVVDLSAPSAQDSGEDTWHWVWESWSQGGPAVQSPPVPMENTTWIARYGARLKPGYGDSFGLVQATTGRWFLYDPVTSDTTSFYYGIPGDTPLMGDWDCDGVDTPGAYRESTGYVYLRNSNSTGIADLTYFFGIPGDIPVVGDFNGNGCDTVSIYRPSEAKFYITNQLGSADQGFVAEYSFFFGTFGDRPFTGDFNGDGLTDVGLHRATTGLVYFRFTLDTGVADSTFFWGVPGDSIITGRWAASGVPGEDTLGLFRPSNSTVYLRFVNTQGIADFVLPYGTHQMRPVAGRFGPLPGGTTPPWGN